MCKNVALQAFLAELPWMLDEKQLAKLFNVSVGKIRKDRRLKRGVKPDYIDGSVRYRQDNITAYLQQFHTDGGENDQDS